MLNSPYSESSQVLELLACLCEHCEAPAILGDTLCQTLAWAIRCETRLPRISADLMNPDVKMKSGDHTDDDDKEKKQSSAQSLAKCINSVFHTLPAAVRHVHAENMVPWALDYLEAPLPGGLELRRSLLGTLATNLCECPSLVPNIMRLSGVWSCTEFWVLHVCMRVCVSVR